MILNVGKARRQFGLTLRQTVSKRDRQKKSVDLCRRFGGPAERSEHLRMTVSDHHKRASGRSEAVSWG